MDSQKNKVLVQKKPLYYLRLDVCALHFFVMATRGVSFGEHNICMRDSPPVDCTFDSSLFAHGSRT